MKKKAATKEPFLPLFFGDFLGATAEWDGEERALYVLLLGYQWTGGSLPNDPRKLRKLVDYQESNFDRWWPTVSTKFEVRAGRLLNPRLEVHRAKTKELSGKNAASGKKGAAARWSGNSDNMADANGNEGERHGSGVANAKDTSGERHQSAIAKRHPKSDGAPDGNPSDPIPSDPIRSGDGSSHDSSVVGGATRTTVPDGAPGGSGGSILQPDPPPTSRMTPQGAMAIALRKLSVNVTSTDTVLLDWINDGYTVEQLVDVVQAIRQTKGDNEIIYPKYIDKRLRDKSRAVAPGVNGNGLHPKPQETPDQREWRVIAERGKAAGFREPNRGEKYPDYERELKQHERRSEGGIARALLGSVLPEMPKP